MHVSGSDSYALLFLLLNCTEYKLTSLLTYLLTYLLTPWLYRTDHSIAV